MARSIISKMRFLTFVFQVMVLAFLVYFPAVASADGNRSCTGHFLCITAEESDSKVDFTFESFTNTPFTIAFSASENGIAPFQKSFHAVTDKVQGPNTFWSFTIPQEDWNLHWKYHSHIGTVTAQHNEKYVYNLPFKSGENVLVSQGYNGTFTHNGPQKYAIDFRVPMGTEVHAARPGVVIGVRSDSSVGGNDLSFGGEENFVWIRQSDGTVAQYLHFQQNGVAVSVGQNISTGQLLGLSGCTGFCRTPHLHFHVSTPRTR